ncbi:MAG TPA: class I SAM-dependent methyltransferase [Polyangiales bacterium]|jgi:ubiquinone/menaquinone biosynthesis C-methylase UbiE|nr:class I SAM-dependent methyltransferase [Polyangiales bacterium]
MGLYSEHFVPRCTDFVLSRAPILQARARVAVGLAGTLLEIGFGSGLNIPYLPRAVTKVLAVEPSAVARKLARKRIERSGLPFEWIGIDGARLALEDASVDSVLSTFTLCTIPDLDGALRELHRVLKPRAGFHFLEHGRSPDAAVAKWQDRITPIQKRLAAGCHLNRPIHDQLRAAGFCIDVLDTYYMAQPKLAAYIYEGRARRC